jgi:Zn2+/Cd2+-exporting ATPase
MEQARCTIRVQGLDCPNEAPPLRAALEGRTGIGEFGIDFQNGQITVDYNPDQIQPAGIVHLIAEVAKMRAEVLSARLTVIPSRDLWRRWAPTVASGVALAVGVIVGWAHGPAVVSQIAYGLAIFAGLATLGPKAVRSLMRRSLDIHVLMSLAILGALALGEWDEAATVAFLFGLSEAIEALSLERARRAVQSLLEIAPDSAERVEPDGSTRVVPASRVIVGDRVRVRAGTRVPIDGRVVSGRSTVDQKEITGESIPVLREPGDVVYAGTVNGDGAMEIEAIRPLDDSVVSRVVERVRSAQRGRTPAERSMERFAAVYTPAVVALALCVMVLPPSLFHGSWRYWFGQGLVVLVIACPCALVIGTPVAVVSALAAAARRGILIKGGQFLEEFGRLRVLAFDKTGTLTRGEPDVVEVVSTAGGDHGDLLRIAAALGDRGGHVLGRAIARHARGLRLEVPEADDYVAAPGLGATGSVGSTEYHIGSHRYIDEAGLCPPDFHASLGSAEGDVGTAVALTAGSSPLGWIRLADRPRPEAAAVVSELRSLGMETIMLTGDNASTAAAVAREVGIREQRSGLLPADKADAVSELNARRGPTGMVGDGVNDAPALAAAKVSVALGGVSSAAALETADIVLMGDDLTALPWLVRQSRRTLRRIHENIALAVGSKIVVLILAIVGFANLWLAIAADLGVSLIVVANALRLLRGPAERRKQAQNS